MYRNMIELTTKNKLSMYIYKNDWIVLMTMKQKVFDPSKKVVSSLANIVLI